MSDARYNFGFVESIKAEAIGEPGQRHFRIVINSTAGQGSLWLEKTQLFRLSVVIKQSLITLAQEKTTGDISSNEPLQTDNDNYYVELVELDVGNISLLQEPNENLFSILVHNVDESPEGKAHVAFKLSPKQMSDFAEEAQEICSAGRPLCPLCNSPIGQDSHRCARSNGHNAN